MLLTLNSFFAYRLSEKQYFNVAVGYCDNLHHFTALGGKYCGPFGLRTLKRNMVAAKVHDKNETTRAVSL